MEATTEPLGQLWKPLKSKCKEKMSMHVSEENGVSFLSDTRKGAIVARA